MPAKRNDVEEESAVEREIAFTRVILALGPGSCDSFLDHLDPFAG